MAAVRATADGDAHATLRNATAPAEAMKVQNVALQHSKDVLVLRRIQIEQTKAARWNEQQPTAIYAGASIPFFHLIESGFQ